MKTLKHWYASKAVWGTVIAFVALVLQSIGIEVSANEQSEIVKWLASTGISLTQLTGILMALYGRIVAQHKISL